MSRTLIFLSAVAAMGIVISSSAQAQLTHRYSFTGNLNDSVGLANGVSSGNFQQLADQILLNLNVTSPNTRDGKVNLVANGANGININTYSATTIEFWASPNCDSAANGCTPNPNDNFSTAFSLGNVQSTSPGGNFPNGAGADYIIMQTHRGDNVSRGAISITDETQNVGPWTAESGANGAELNDAGEHQYAVVINGANISWYVDGVATGTTALANVNSHGLANRLAGVSNALAVIGTGYTIDQNWTGAMNELRIYNAAANANYIKQSFTLGPDSLAPFSPEPSSVVLAIIGLSGFAMMLRRKARA